MFGRGRRSSRPLWDALKGVPYRGFLPFIRNLTLRRINERGNRARALIAARSCADRDRAFCGLPIADYEHVGDLLELSLSDLISNLLLPFVEVDAQTGRFQRCQHRSAIFQVTIRNRQHDRLHGRQPQREGAGEVLDENRNEAFEAAENGPMNDDRLMLGVVRPGIFQAETLRNLIIELNRRTLPLATDRVGDVEIDLGPVEGAVALVQAIGLSGLFERLLKLRFR